MPILHLSSLALHIPPSHYLHIPTTITLTPHRDADKVTLFPVPLPYIPTQHSPLIRLRARRRRSIMRRWLRLSHQPIHVIWTRGRRRIHEQVDRRLFVYFRFRVGYYGDGFHVRVQVGSDEEVGCFLYVVVVENSKWLIKVLMSKINYAIIIHELYNISLCIFKVIKCIKFIGHCLANIPII